MLGTVLIQLWLPIRIKWGEENADTWTSPPESSFYWSGIELGIGISVYKALQMMLMNSIGGERWRLPAVPGQDHTSTVHDKMGKVRLVE